VALMSEVTQLLRNWSGGDHGALERVMTLVYADLRRLAAQQLSGERLDHTLQVTGLVNEAYLRLCDQRAEWTDRRHFLLIAATLMRRVLVDHARRQQAVKRPPPESRMSIDDVDPAALRVDQDLLALDGALAALEMLDARQARIVELRYFVGMDIDETARTMQLSVSTVTREWRMARAWLQRRLDA
jgi:RNA polymerase sigma factor (TIGR02999 family)